MRDMNERMMKIAVGKIGKEAIKLVSIEYLNYMIEHPGVYETIQWAVWHGTEETATIFNNYLSLLTTLIQSCSLNKDKTLEILKYAYWNNSRLYNFAIRKRFFCLR